MNMDEIQEFLNKIDKIELEHLAKSLEEHIRRYPEIYIIKCEQYYKIGISYDAYKRLKSLETSNPFPLTLLYHLEVKDASKLEAQIHSRFKKKNVKGEWFELNNLELKFIIKWIKKEENS